MIRSIEKLEAITLLGLGHKAYSLDNEYIVNGDYYSIFQHVYFNIESASDEEINDHFKTQLDEFEKRGFEEYEGQKELKPFKTINNECCDNVEYFWVSERR